MSAMIGGPGALGTKGLKTRRRRTPRSGLGILPVAGGVVLTWAFVVQSRRTATRAGL